MSIEAAEQSLREMPGFVPPAPGEARNRGFAHYESELSVSVDFNSLGVVRAIELFRPEKDVQVVFRGVNLFAESADAVISQLAEMFHVEIKDGGLNITAPSVFIGLWRSVLPEDSGGDEGRHFESVIVAAPGYGP